MCNVCGCVLWKVVTGRGGGGGGEKGDGDGSGSDSGSCLSWAVCGEWHFGLIRNGQAPPCTLLVSTPNNV